MAPDAPSYLTVEDGDTVLPAIDTMVRGIRSGSFRTAPLEPGTQVSHYRVLRRIGDGGMSTVYEAEHVYLKRRAALKTVRSEFADTVRRTKPETEAGRSGSTLAREEIGGRFVREAHVLARLNHPGVIQVLDMGYENGIPYLVTELLRGSTLRDSFGARAPFSPHETMDLLEEIGAVLRLQERKGILHRDIKPGNVWRRSDDRFLLFDYGISELGVDEEAAPEGGVFDTGVGTLIGTPAYMAPEQVLRGDRVDHRADIFALGLTAWESLTGFSFRSSGDYLVGRVPAPLEKVPSVRQHREAVPQELDTILQTMTAPSPDERYPSAEALLEDLQEYRYGGRRPVGSPRGTVFLALPFSQSFDAVHQAIVGCCLDVRLAPRRVDRIVEAKDIWAQIVREMENSLAVLADFSSAPSLRGPNPNVVTEAAHARALGKHMILITQDPVEQMPFDWRHVPVTRYEPTEEGFLRLAAKLEPELRHCARRAQGTDV